MLKFDVMDICWYAVRVGWGGVAFIHENNRITHKQEKNALLFS